MKDKTYIVVKFLSDGNYASASTITITPKYLRFFDPADRSPVWANVNEESGSFSDALSFPTKKAATLYVAQRGYPAMTIVEKNDFKRMLIRAALT